MAWAAIVLVTAVWLSWDPSRSEDLRRVAVWVRAWVGGAHLYGAGSDVDYPPWAIVVLAPLAWVPDRALLPGWIAANILCAVWLARVLTRMWGSPGARGAVWMLGAAAMGRTLNQFSLPAMLAGALAISGRSPVWLWLGLSLIKPQIGLVFVGWLVCRRRWRDVAAAVAVPAALSVVYAVVAGVNPASVPAAYLTILAEQQAGLGGRTEVLWMAHRLMPAAPAVALALVIAAAAAWPAWRRHDAAGYAHLALASLLAVRHQSYDLILLLPWVASLRRAWFVGAAVLVAVDPAAMASAVERIFVGTAWVSGWINQVFLVALLGLLFRDMKRQQRT